MKMSNLKSMVSLKAKAKSPELLLAAGVIGIVVSTVMACRSSRKVDDILDEHTEKIEEVKKTYSETNPERKTEITKTYVQTGAQFARLYAPAAAIGVLSLGCIFQSHHILRGRNIALAAAYGGLEKAYKKYRDRVISELGESADRRFRLGSTEEKIEITEIDEKGKEKTKKEVVEIVDADFSDASPYSKIFDEFSTKWEDDPEYNMMFLRTTEQYANDYLRAHGHLFLNQVYEWLGFKSTRVGQVVGWVYDPRHGDGDNFVDFGIRKIYKRAAAGDVCDKMFINGLEASTFLDFNVDGNIMDVAFT